MKHIQEDHLQQLALFSEYGRVVAMTNEESVQKPFQTIEFLVRDWQHFDADEDGEIEPLEEEMSAYLEKVLGEREAQELQNTREHIKMCFDEISCYMLTHPGMAVMNKKYDGDTKKIDTVFLKLLDRFCKNVLGGKCLQPKKINGSELTVSEFTNYAIQYAALFKNGANFPHPTTMLEATANANNMNAIEECMKLYKEIMDTVAGPQVNACIEPQKLENKHQYFRSLALEKFDWKANFGNKHAIEISRQELVQKIEDAWNNYKRSNEAKKPAGDVGK